MKSNTRCIAKVLLLVASLAAGAQALAQPGQMMSNQDMQNMMQNRGSGPGYNYGNWGMGPGMMGMGGYGSGMMGGGYGQGMMGGMGGMGGMGMMGMGGTGPMMMLNLTDDQQKKADAIYDELHKRHWDLMGKMSDESRKLRDLYRASPRDAKQIGAVYAKMFDYKRQVIESMIDAQNRQEALLTKEQKEQLQQWRGHMPWYQ